MTLVESHGLANRPGEPYPATFRMSVDPPRVELGSPPRQGGVVPLDHEPSVVSYLFQPVAIPHLQFILRPEPTFRVAHPAMGRTHGAANPSTTFSCGLSALAHSGPAGESNPDLLVAGQVSSRWTSRPRFREVRPGIEPGLRPYHGRVLPEHLQTILCK
jgi:hypothetical protein